MVSLNTGNINNFYQQIKDPEERKELESLVNRYSDHSGFTGVFKNAWYSIVGGVSSLYHGIVGGDNGRDRAINILINNTTKKDIYELRGQSRIIESCLSMAQGVSRDYARGVKHAEWKNSRKSEAFRSQVGQAAEGLEAAASSLPKTKGGSKAKRGLPDACSGVMRKGKKVAGSVTGKLGGAGKVFTKAFDAAAEAAGEFAGGCESVVSGSPYNFSEAINQRPDVNLATEVFEQLVTAKSK